MGGVIPIGDNGRGLTEAGMKRIVQAGAPIIGQKPVRVINVSDLLRKMEVVLNSNEELRARIEVLEKEAKDAEGNGLRKQLDIGKEDDAGLAEESPEELEEQGCQTESEG